MESNTADSDHRNAAILRDAAEAARNLHKMLDRVNDPADGLQWFSPLVARAREAMREALSKVAKP